MIVRNYLNRAVEQLKIAVGLSRRESLVNCQYENGDTPLHLAVKIHKDGSHDAICKMLLEEKADPNIPDNEGNTPLDTAMRNRSESLVQLLKKHGATLPSNRR